MTANASNTASNLQPSELAQDPAIPNQADRYQAEIQALKTELHQTRLAYQMAIEMAQFQAGFLARTSHELRSPINSVIGLHQLILSDLCDSPEEERDFVAQAHNAAQKMLGLMDELIHISQLVQQTACLNLVPVPLVEVLAAVEQATHLQANNRNLQLEIQLPEPSVTVLTDERRLRQVLIHLVDLPLSLMQQGFVRVSAKVFAETVEIEIVDQRPADCWQESIDLLPLLKGELIQPTDKESALQALSRSPVPPSLGLRLLAQRSLLELLGGQLVLLETPAMFDPSSENAQPEGITRLHCVLPLAAAS